MSVVIPCLNEERTIAHVVAQVKEAIADLGVATEVVVADNDSDDSSAAAAAAAGARVVQVTPRGYGYALQGGISASCGRAVVTLDGDGTYHPGDIPSLVAELWKGYDIVIGSRYMGRREKGSMSLRSRIGNPLLTWLLNVLYGTRLSDTHSGMRAFTRETWERLQLISGGMEWAPEMCIKASVLKLRIAEIPIRYLAAPKGRRSHQRTLRDGWRHLRLLLTYRPEVSLLAPGLAAALLAPSLLVLQMTAELPAATHMAIVAGGSLVALLGHFALSAYLVARVFLSAVGLRPWTDQLDRVLRTLTAERAIVGILMMLALSVTVGAAALLKWARGDGGSLEIGLAGLAIATGLVAFQSFLLLFLCSLIVEAAASLQLVRSFRSEGVD